MIAKNKGDFLYQLHHELHRIGIDNDEEIFADFEEHFKESQEAGMSEEETCEKLGDVKEIARNYLDIPSTRLNSIVADAVANQRVSLTKPGEKLPADLSLVEQDKADPAPEQPAIREYTPEHIAQEPETPQSAVPTIDLNKDAARAACAELRQPGYALPVPHRQRPEAGQQRGFLQRSPLRNAAAERHPQGRKVRGQGRIQVHRHQGTEAERQCRQADWLYHAGPVPLVVAYPDGGVDNIRRMRQRFCRACSRRIRAAGQRLLPRHQQDTAVQWQAPA